MEKISPNNAFELSKSFRDISVSLGNYRFANWENLNEQERQNIESIEWSLLNASSDILTIAVGIELDETKFSYEYLQNTTSNAKNTLSQLKTIQDVLSFATTIVSLAGAIISRDLGAIGKSIKDVYDTIS